MGIYFYYIISQWISKNASLVQATNLTTCLLRHAFWTPKLLGRPPRFFGNILSIHSFLQKLSEFPLKLYGNGSFYNVGIYFYHIILMWFSKSAILGQTTSKIIYLLKTPCDFLGHSLNPLILNNTDGTFLQNSLWFSKYASLVHSTSLTTYI